MQKQKIGFKSGFKSYKKSSEELFVESAVEHNIIKENFNAVDLRKVGTLISKMASKRLGDKFTFLWQENFKKSNGQKGTGALFVGDKGTMLRYNFIKGKKGSYSINAIDFWKNRKIGATPNKSITFFNQNIVEITDILMEYFATGKLLEESFDINEADSPATVRWRKRVEFAEAYSLGKSYANTAKGLREAAERENLISEYNDTFGEVLVAQNIDEVTDKTKELDNSERQLGASGIYSDPEFVFKDMETASKTVADGNWRSAIYAGGPGLGKTHGTREMLLNTLGTEQEGPQGKWAYYTGAKISAFGLYQILLLNRHKLIVFDDSNSILQSSDSVEMLKSANANDGERRISWGTKAVANVSLMSTEEREQYEFEYTAALMEDPNTNMKPPSSFIFEGSIIIITNLKADKVNEALKSRAIFIDLYLAERDVIRRMYTIKKLQGLSDTKIRMLLQAVEPEADDALAGKGKFAGKVKYITPEDARKRNGLNMRSLNIAEALYDSGAARWKEMSALYA